MHTRARARVGETRSPRDRYCANANSHERKERMRIFTQRYVRRNVPRNVRTREMGCVIENLIKLISSVTPGMSRKHTAAISKEMTAQ